MSDEEKLDINLDIAKQNKKFNLDMPWLPMGDSEDWYDDMKGWWRIINKKRSDEIERWKRKEIEDCIERRCEMIANNQGKMLNSLLNRPHSKVVVDRLFKEEGATKVLVTSPSKVREETKIHYENQMRARKPQNFSRRSIWSRIYEPMTCIQSTWFQDILSEITEEEWGLVLQSFKTKTAPGISGITYSLIKNASPSTQRIFRKFANYCIIEASFPKEWKCAQIYPIPKGTS